MLGFIRDYFVYIWSIFFKKNNQVPALPPEEKDNNSSTDKNTEAKSDSSTATDNQQILTNEADSATLTVNSQEENNIGDKSPQTLKKIKAVSDFHTQFKLSEDKSSDDDNNLAEEEREHKNGISTESPKRFQLGIKTPQSSEEQTIDFLRKEREVTVPAKNILNKEQELQPITPVQLPEKQFNHFQQRLNTDFNKEQNFTQLKSEAAYERKSEEPDQQSKSVGDLGGIGGTNKNYYNNSRDTEETNKLVVSKEDHKQKQEEETTEEEDETSEEIEEEEVEEDEEEEVDEEELEEEEETGGDGDKIFSRIEDKSAQLTTVAAATTARLQK